MKKIAVLAIVAVILLLAAAACGGESPEPTTPVALAEAAPSDPTAIPVPTPTPAPTSRPTLSPPKLVTKTPAPTPEHPPTTTPEPTPVATPTPLPEPANPLSPLELAPGQERWSGVRDTEIECMREQFPGLEPREVMEDPYNNASRIALCLEKNNQARLLVNQWLRITGALSVQTSDCFVEGTNNVSMMRLINTAAMLNSGRDSQATPEQKLMMSAVGMLLQACMNSAERDRIYTANTPSEERAILCAIGKMGGTRNFLYIFETMGTRAMENLNVEANYCARNDPLNSGTPAPTPTAMESCDQLLEQQLVYGRHAQDAADMRLIVEHIQNEKEECVASGWNPVPTDPSRNDDREYSHPACQFPPEGTPPGLVTRGGRLRVTTGRDADNNIAVYWDRESVLSRPAECWIFDSAFNEWTQVEPAEPERR